MKQRARIPFAILIVSGLAIGLAALHASRASAQEEDSGSEVSGEGADASSQEGGGEAVSSDFEDGAVVEDTHNPAAAGDSVEGAEPGEAAHGAGGAASAPPSRQNPNANRWRQRDKQAEGTKAQKRSGKDLVIHSQYELNGRKLEVDPD